MNDNINQEIVAKESVAARLAKVFLTLGLHFLLLLLLVLVLARLIPVHTKFFDEENITLPAITVSLVSTSMFVIAYWYLVVLVGMMLDVPMLLFIYFVAARQRWLRSLYRFIWLFGMILFLFVSMIAVAMPMEKYLLLSD